jgi:hypothetical protein
MIVNPVAISIYMDDTVRPKINIAIISPGINYAPSRKHING